MQPTPWTPDTIEKLRTLVAEMAAANGKIRIRDIADALHLNKNQVIGKLQRLRQRDGSIPNLRIPALWARPEGNRHRRKVRHVRRIPPVPPIPEPPQLEPPAIGTVTLLELRDCMCRWPYGEAAPYLFCGAPAERGWSYCPWHVRIARGGQGR